MVSIFFRTPELQFKVRWLVFFQAFELQVCQFVCEGNLHWRHKQMALGLMFTTLVSGHVPPQEVVEMWLQVRFLTKTLES